jgi:hypothetical protein
MHHPVLRVRSFGCNGVQFGDRPTFQMNILPPALGSEGKQIMKPPESVPSRVLSKLHVITTHERWVFEGSNYGISTVGFWGSVQGVVVWCVGIVLLVLE